MTVSNADRAAILVHALPYIKKYTGKIVVIKYGGSAMQSETLKNSVVRDVILLHLIGVKVVLVHGGGPEITDLLTRLGKETQFVGGLRVTDRETVEVAQMVLAGKVNKSLVNLIECSGGHAVGLCGMDGHMISAVQKEPALGYVGKITAVDPTPVLDLLEKGYIPVVSTLGCDDAGNVYNVNADTAAAKLAATLHAESGYPARQRRPLVSHLARDGRRDRAAHRRRRDRGRHAAEGGMLHRRHPRRRAPRLHHRRARAAFDLDRDADR